MSLRTKINCYTGWVNFRLLEHENILTNVITDLLTGVNMKQLVGTMVGYAPKRLGSMDDITQNQVITRVEWAVSELKQNNVIPPATAIDARMFAMRSADQVFDLLWRLVIHDINFLWDRQEFLRLNDNKKLCEVPMKWVPDQIPTRQLKQHAAIDADDAMLMGFGNTAAASQSVEYEPVPADFERFSGQQTCLSYKPSAKRSKKRPSPEKCILDLLQSQFNVTDEGKELGIKSLKEIGNSHAFCALMNTFVPDTFSNEILLKDRWAFNLALKTFEKMANLQTPVTSEDFVDFDSQSVCTYLTTFFMLMYKYKQCQGVVKRFGELKMMIRRSELELHKLEDKWDEYSKVSREHWEESQRGATMELEKLNKLYDIPWCENWIKHVTEMQKQTRQLIRMKMKDRFDPVLVPRNMTVSEIVQSLNINLSLTKCNGFAKLSTKEYVPADKRMVIRNKKTGEYLDDFTGTGKEGFSVRRHLGYSTNVSVEVKPDNHPKYDIFVEIHSMNKTMKAGIEYLYLVFPGGMAIYENMLQKAVKNGEFEMVRKFVIFFNSPAYVNCKEPNTGNTPIHWACRFGYDEIALFLLEHGADINCVNATQCTPFFYAMSNIHKICAQLLIEWGCDTWYKDHSGKSAWDVVRNQGLKETLFEFYEYLAEHVPNVVKGDTETLGRIIEEHVHGVHPFASLRSRAIQGSTLLHTACHFGHKDSVELLLSEGVEVNVKDYKGATPLHRSHTAACITILIDAGADVTLTDQQGNTPFHMLCYEELDACMDLLLKRGSNLLARNNSNMLPIHCAAMNGHIQTVLAVLAKDEDAILNAIWAEPAEGGPPSLMYLALTEFHIDCATQLKAIGISFKAGEAQSLLYKYLTGSSRSDVLVEMMQFLLDNGASVGDRFEGEQLTPLHLVSANILFTDLIDIFVTEYEADIETTDTSGSSQTKALGAT